MKEYRVVRLYRPLVGWRWWLQRGFWAETNGPMGIATGNPKRKFVVEWEQDYPNKHAALESMNYWKSRQK